MVRKLIVLAILIGCGFFSSEFAYSDNTPIPKVTVKEYIVKHSMELGIDPALALSIAKQESGFRHELKSPYGAVGVFQLLPATAKKMGYNPYYLSDNIKGGLKYYQMMYKQFGSVELALAAYNAGPGNVARYKGMPPFKETKVFVNQIMTEYKNQKNNPDPAIIKYKESIAKKNENILKPQKSSPTEDIVEVNETPEVNDNVKDNEPVNLKDLLSMKAQ
ncbi:lytic transglycosylase domain-containing protein [bacterium]|nr:lytic transglycosylase domain-containing protein [bacterium]